MHISYIDYVFTHQQIGHVHQLVGIYPYVYCSFIQVHTLYSYNLDTTTINHPPVMPSCLGRMFNISRMGGLWRGFTQSTVQVYICHVFASTIGLHICTYATIYHHSMYIIYIYIYIYWLVVSTPLKNISQLG